MKPRTPVELALCAQILPSCAGTTSIGFPVPSASSSDSRYATMNDLPRGIGLPSLLCARGLARG